MGIPVDFVFNQNNIQTYVDCQRRFELMFLLKQSWPAPVTEPILEFEKHQKLGVCFHLLVQQQLAGIPENQIESSIVDPDLSRWWKNYVQFAPRFASEKCFCEYYQSIPFQEYRLSAKYDLLIIQDDDQITIIDWKTNRRKMIAGSLKKRIQTLVYPLVTYEALNSGNNYGQFLPEKIEMIYWFPEFPMESVTFHFTNQVLQDSKAQLTGIIEEISKKTSNHFFLTDNTKQCMYCNYRSLCDRGNQAGTWSENMEIDLSDDDQATEPLIED